MASGGQWPSGTIPRPKAGVETGRRHARATSYRCLAHGTGAPSVDTPIGHVGARRRRLSVDENDVLTLGPTRRSLITLMNRSRESKPISAERVPRVCSDGGSRGANHQPRAGTGGAPSAEDWWFAISGSPGRARAARLAPRGFAIFVPGREAGSSGSRPWQRRVLSALSLKGREPRGGDTGHERRSLRRHSRAL